MNGLAHPWALAAAVVLPVLAGMLTVTRRRRQRVPALAVTTSRRPGALDAVALALALTGLAAAWLAVAGPRRPARDEAVPAGLDLVLLLDTSGSMAGGREGGEPGAVTARRVTERFVASRPGDRISVVAFAGKAAVLAPLTRDHDALLAATGRLEPGALGGGTAIGDAIAVALERLRRTPPGSAAIVLVSDGLSNAGAVAPTTAAEVAAARGIPIETVLVGAGASQAGGGRDEVLGAVARATRGSALRAGDAAGLDRAFAELSRLRPSPSPAAGPPRWDDLAHLPARWAAVLLLAAGACELSGRRVWG